MKKQRVKGIQNISEEEQVKMAVRASTFKRYQELTGSYHDENSRTLKYTMKGVGSSEIDCGLKRNLGQMSLKIIRKNLSHSTMCQTLLI